MAEGAIFLNSGPLFNAERLESLETTPEWSEVDEAARMAFTRVKEAFEKHATLLAGRPSAEETRYFMVNPSLHALGFMHSVHEQIEVAGEQALRVDYVLFSGSVPFLDASVSRGGMSFYHDALAIVRAVEWAYNLEQGAVEGDGDDTNYHPAAELDLLLGATSRDYGILTNGCDWRLYHRATSGQSATWFQADMIAAMKSDFEDFKRFYLLFRKEAFLKDDSGESFLDRMLQ
jgi:hypothetical protein